MRTETMSISEFMNGTNAQHEPFSAKIDRHFRKYGTVYKVAGVTLIILASGIGSHAFASGLIDVEAKKLYRELVGIGKWFIVFKGGINVIKGIGDGNMDAAKSAFFSSVFIYLILLALPYGLDKVDGIFDKISTVPTTGGM